MKIQDPHFVLGRGLKRKFSQGSDSLLDGTVMSDDILDSICVNLVKVCKIDPDADNYPALNVKDDMMSAVLKLGNLCLGNCDIVSGACEHCTFRDLGRLGDLFISLHATDHADVHATDHAHANSPHATGHAKPEDHAHAHATNLKPTTDDCTDSGRSPQEPLMVLLDDASGPPDAVSTCSIITNTPCKGPTPSKRLISKICAKPKRKSKLRSAELAHSTAELAKMKQRMDAHFARQPATNGSNASQ